MSNSSPGCKFTIFTMLYFTLNNIMLSYYGFYSCVLLGTDTIVKTFEVLFPVTNTHHQSELTTSLQSKYYFSFFLYEPTQSLKSTSETHIIDNS